MVISPPTEAVEARRRFWLDPRFGTAWFRRTRKQRLESNPIFWLQQFSPNAGLTGRGWLSLVVLAWLVVAALCLQEPGAAVLGWFVAPLLLVAVAFASAGSFRREIEEGTLELILVTPVRFRQIVAGRVWMLWRQFLPPMILAALLAIWWIPALDGHSVSFRAGFERDLTPQFWLTAGALTSLATLPPIGLRFALRRLNPLLGWPMTLAIGVVAPLIAALCATSFFASLSNFEEDSHWTLWTGGLCFVVFQAVVAAWWWRMCEWDLASRHFMLRPFRRRHA